MATSVLNGSSMMVPMQKRTVLNQGSWRWLAFGLLIVWIVITPVTSSGESEAILQLRPDGPLGLVHAIEFSADGSTMYAAGNDKLVQVWHLRNGQFQRSHSASLRHRIGPGPLGAINAMSVSGDERYVVVGGIAAFQQHAGYSFDGIIIPSF